MHGVHSGSTLKIHQDGSPKQRAQEARGRALTLAHELDPVELFRQYPTQALLLSAALGFVVGTSSRITRAITHSVPSRFSSLPDILSKVL